MKQSTLLLSLCFSLAAQTALADDTPAPPAPSTASRASMAEVRTACESDVQKLCAGVQPGGGRLIACLKEHKDEVSSGCKQAILKAKQNPAQ